MLSNFHNKKVKLKSSKSRKLSSTRWLQRQLNDPYVQAVKKQGYRSRSAYKLLEIHQKFKIFNNCNSIIDLGAAPGGWCQVASQHSQNTKIIAIDLLDIKPITGVNFIKGDFHDMQITEKIKELLQGNLVDLIISDMAANTTGHLTIDHIRTIDLCEKALNLATTILKPGGNFITKIFQGSNETHLFKKIQHNFNQVKYFKPSACRKNSRETYLVALSFKT